MPNEDRIVDCHAHIIDTARFPFTGTKGYRTRPDEGGTREEFCATLDRHGVGNAVLIQLSGYGTDNAANLDAMKAYPGRFKAIAGIDPDASDKTLEDLAAAGVVGVRFNLVSYEPDALSRRDAPRLLQRMKALGWFAQVYADDAQWPDTAAVLRQSGIRVLVDHFGVRDIDVGTRHAGFQAVLALGRDGQYDGEAVVAVSGLAHAQRLRRSGSVRRRAAEGLRRGWLHLGIGLAVHQRAPASGLRGPAGAVDAVAAGSRRQSARAGAQSAPSLRLWRHEHEIEAAEGRAGRRRNDQLVSPCRLAQPGRARARCRGVRSGCCQGREARRGIFDPEGLSRCRCDVRRRIDRCARRHYATPNARRMGRGRGHARHRRPVPEAADANAGRVGGARPPGRGQVAPHGARELAVPAVVSRAEAMDSRG